MDKEFAIERLTEIRDQLESQLNELTTEADRFRGRLAIDPTMDSMNLFEPIKNYLINRRSTEELKSGIEATVERFMETQVDEADVAHQLTIDACQLVFQLYRDDLLQSPAEAWRLTSLRDEAPVDRDAFSRFWNEQLKQAMIDGLGIVIEPSAFEDIEVAINVCDSLIGLLRTDDPTQNVQYRRFISLISVYAEGNSEDRLQAVLQVAKDPELTAEQKLVEMDKLWPIPTYATSRQLGNAIGVSHAAIQKTQFWRDHSRRRVEKRLSNLLRNRIETEPPG